MPYDAKVYNIMIASPADTYQVREAAKEIILEWNEIHSATTRIILFPLMWEDNVTPELNNREAQDNIDEQIGKHADLLIAIFWTRVGTPTSLFKSGTIQEIEKHIASKKPAMLYFSNEPVTPTSNALSQIQAVEKIKEKYKGRGVYWEYKSQQQFENLLKKHLPLKINQRNDFFKGYNAAQQNQIEDNNLSYEAIELLIAVSKNHNSRIERNSNLGYLKIRVNQESFGVSGIDSTIQKYYDAIEELIKREMANSPSGDSVSVRTKGIEEAKKLISPLDEKPFISLLDIIEKYNQINNSTYPIEEERVSQKRIAATEMSSFIKSNLIPLQHIHYALIGENNEGKLIALMNSVLTNPSKQHVLLIYSHFKKATSPFSKHLILVTIEEYIRLNLIIKFDHPFYNRILGEYSRNADQALKSKIECIRNLIK